MHGLLRSVGDHLAHLVGTQALDSTELAGRVVDDPLADRLAVGGHVDRVARLELTLDLGDPDRQQAAAALAKNAGRPLVDPQPAVARLRVTQPELEAGGALAVGG